MRESAASRGPEPGTSPGDWVQPSHADSGMVRFTEPRRPGLVPPGVLPPGEAGAGGGVEEGAGGLAGQKVQVGVGA